MEKTNQPNSEPKNVLEYIEPRDTEVIEKLKSLGLNFEYFISNEDKFVYTFNNVIQVDPSAFWLDAGDKKIIYQALHFGQDSFCETTNEEEIKPEELLKYLSKKFPDAEHFVFSCCSPDTARRFFESQKSEITFIGTGTGSYSTWYNKADASISSVKNTKIK